MKALYILLLIMSCLSCKTIYQVSELKSSNVKEDNAGKKFYYEDNNLKISYNLWSHKGTLTYTIFNKTNKPIYFDWANSNFIWNRYSIDYLKNIEIVKSISSSVILNNDISTQGFSINSKEKPQTQLPPQASIVINRFNIDMPFIKMSNYKKRVKDTTYNKDSSFFVFRNYLAYSFDKDLKSLSFIDNNFWVNKIYEMPKKSFKKSAYPNSELKDNKYFTLKRKAKPKLIYGIPLAIIGGGGATFGLLVLIFSLLHI